MANINELIFNKYLAATALFIENEYTIDNLLIVGDKITNLRFNNSMSIYVDGVKVQADFDVIYISKDDSILVRILFEEDVLDNIKQYYILPIMRPQSIGCSICGNYYLRGMTPCDCIFMADKLFINDTDIVSCHIYEKDNFDKVKVDMRNSLLQDFFGYTVWQRSK